VCPVPRQTGAFGLTSSLFPRGGLRLQVAPKSWLRRVVRRMSPLKEDQSVEYGRE
jgi:hypothetical protein